MTNAMHCAVKRLSGTAIARYITEASDERLRDFERDLAAETPLLQAALAQARRELKRRKRMAKAEKPGTLRKGRGES